MISYRSATDQDYEFCRTVHHEGMKPYVAPLWGWDDEFQDSCYKKLWEPAKIKIIQKDKSEIGYLETSISESEISLLNIEVPQKCGTHCLDHTIFH